MNKEQFYDEQIAPKLFALAKECEEHGLSFLALCEYGADKTASTRTLQPDASWSMRMADLAVRAHGNVDSMMMAIEKHARHWGHSSIYLTLRGIPAQVTPPIDESAASAPQTPVST